MPVLASEPVRDPQAVRPISPVPPSPLFEARRLYDVGQYVQSLMAAERAGPLHRWTSVPDRILVSRIERRMGNERGSRLELIRTYQQHPTDALACTEFGLFQVLGVSGPWAALKFFEEKGPLEAAPADLRCDWLILHALALGGLRDHSEAEKWISQAEAIQPDSPWLWVSRGHLALLQDQFERALDFARCALSLRPWYRPAVLLAARMLHHLQRGTESLEMLTEASTRLESAEVVWELAALQEALGQYENALCNWHRAAELLPRMDRHMFCRLAANISDAHRLNGSVEKAVELAVLADSPFHRAVADNMRQHPSGTRVLLPVPFVAQHHLTCAPATLTAISQYWGLPADHLSVARQICYGGTTARAERHWAEENGWVVKEFTVTWLSAVELINRGIPFTLATVDSGTAHLQAVVGYDACRRTLLLRDPSRPSFAELAADAGLAHYAFSGPRGMAMVPPSQAQRLEGVELPDQELYLYSYRVADALEGHDRKRAAELQRSMRAQAPEHRLTLEAAKAFASYDGNASALLECADKLLARFPDAVRLVLWRASCLGQQAQRAEGLAFLEDRARRPKADALIGAAYGAELTGDARKSEEASWLLRRTLRLRPDYAPAYAAMADLLWNQDQRRQALRLYRFALCLDETNENTARSYFIAARHVGETAEALAVLEGRFERLGRGSGEPAKTLSWALEQIERDPDAFAVLERAQAQRPKDGSLMLAAAALLLRQGEVQRASALLERARSKVREVDLLGALSHLANHQRDREAERRYLTEWLELEPWSLAAHRQMAELLAETTGLDSALTHLQSATERFPQAASLHALHLAWLRDQEPERALEVARRVVELRPDDELARKDLAVQLIQCGDRKEAFKELWAAQCIQPRSEAILMARGGLLARTGHVEEARKAYRDSLERSIEFSAALQPLLQLAADPKSRRGELAFVAQQLRRQRLFHGHCLTAFQQAAADGGDAEETLALLRELHRDREDLWPSWSALIRQLVQLGHLDEALGLGERATRRFPFFPAAWLDLACVREARKEKEEERACLRQALRVRPFWPPAALRLAASFESEGLMDEAEGVLVRAAQGPLDSALLVRLASFRWRNGKKDAALEPLKRALAIGDCNRWAWERLGEWCEHLGIASEAADFARHLTQSLPGNASVWQGLAIVLQGPGAVEERLAALDRAISLTPRDPDLYDDRALFLAQAGRFDEAQASASPEIFGSERPLTLEGRAAWILAERGDLESAQLAMAQALKRDPAYWFGNYFAADWAFQLNQHEVAEFRARRLVELAPENEVAHGFLARALLANGKRLEARGSLRKALELSPGYVYAAYRLIDELLEAAEHQEARAVLEKSKPHLNLEDQRVLALKIAIQTEDPAAVSAHLGDVLRLNPVPEHELETAMGGLKKQGLASLVRKVLNQVVRESAASKTVGRWWTRLCLPTVRFWKRESALRAIRGTPAGDEATVAYLEQLGEKRRGRALKAFLRKEAKAGRPATGIWAAVGYAFTSLGWHAKALAWMADWRERNDLVPWMLINLRLAATVEGEHALAREATARALGLPADHTQDRHRLWAAFDSAMAGNATDARASMESLPRLEWTLDLFLLQLIKILISAASKDEPGDSWTWRPFREAVRTLMQVRGASIYCRVFCQALQKVHAWRRSPLDWLVWAYLRAEAWIIQKT